MAFTFDFNTDPLVAQVRALIPDTQPPGIFSDDEINFFLYANSSQGLYVSGQANPGAASASYVPQIYSVRLSAAMALDVIAARLSRQCAIEQLLDVKQNCKDAAAQSRESAKALREAEENMGNFAIAEMVNDQFSARERVRNQLLRIEGA